jgi:hypothetical protein
MARLIRLDRTGHTTLAEWTGADQDATRAAVEAFQSELERGMIGSATSADGTATVVRRLPVDAELVIMRRPIAGG